jgi:hypothetical protein
MGGVYQLTDGDLDARLAQDISRGSRAVIVSECQCDQFEKLTQSQHRVEEQI